VARGGFFRRAVAAVRDFFSGEREEAPPRATPAPPFRDRDRQRARERDPFLADWDRRKLNRVGYMQHREMIDDMALTYDLDAEEKYEFWQDYLRWIVGKKGVRMQYRRSDLRNPFWQKWGIDPEEDFDWHDWREAMGYPHGNRRSR
jgi:hypothetical protein